MKKLFVLIAIGTLLAGCSHQAKTENPDAQAGTPAAQANAQEDRNAGTDGQDAGTADQNAGTDDSGTKDEKEIKPEGNQEMTMDAFGYQVDSFTTASGKSIAFHCIKHGSLRIEYDGLEFEIDPVKSLNDKVTAYEQFPKADYILVTHEHFDHYDAEAIGSLEKQRTTVITNKSCASMLGKGDIMANGDSRKLRDDISLDAVPAYNTTPGHEKYHPKGRDNGFVLTLDGFRIYIAGDTEDISEMGSIKDIDVAFLPCNLPYTMSPKQLAHAAEMVQPKVLFPYHYGETSMDEVRTLLKDSPIDLRIRNYQ